MSRDKRTTRFTTLQNMNNTHARVNTYEQGTVGTRHHIRNHEVSIVFAVLATKIFREEGVVIAGTWTHVTYKSHDQVKDLWILGLDPDSVF